MTVDRRRQVESLCLEALARDTDSRAAFLDEACAGDAELRREVDSLLAGQAGAAGFLERPAWQAPSTPLTPGTRLGPYEIDAAIGAGGMGEVYKARDTRLGRTVAIKVLPAGVAADPDRRRRFEQEARAASALNHPHICALFDIGESLPSGPEPLAPGPRPLAPVSYLVMEHLDGQTLAARLTKGKLPVTQALEIGIQIADALSAAHKHGIVHRDLKPGNVMLIKGDGGAALQVKLLDFGLAKLRPSLQSPEGDGSGVPTVTAPATTKGMVVGTAPYMAPEQVEGKPTDARTDLFAFGTVLYEMLTGTRAFGGDSSAAVMAAILEHEPRPLAEVAPLTPPALDRLIRRCLAKDPDARWESAHDVADELRWIRENPGVGTAASVSSQRHRMMRATLLITSALILLLAAAGLMWLLRPSPPVTSILRSTLPVSPADEVNGAGFVPTMISTPGGSRTAFAWTPDGQALVFVGRRSGVRQLYVRRLDAAEARLLIGTERAQAPVVTTDGQWVVFWANGAISKVPLAGGPVVALLPNVTLPPFGLVSDAHGALYFGRDDGRIWTMPAGGSPGSVTTVGEGELAHTLPWPLPDGRTLLYTVRKRVWSWGDEEVVAQTLETGVRKVLLKDAADARYVPTGHLVFLRRGVLWAVPFDAKRLEIRGAEVPLLAGVAQALTGGNSNDVTGAGQIAIAPAGTLAWLPSPVLPHTKNRLVMVDRRGQITPLPGEMQSYSPEIGLSPDGHRLAVTIRSLIEVGLWVHDLGRGTLTPLTVDGEADIPRWSPDGKRLAFRWLRNGRIALGVQPADGSAPPEAVLLGDFNPSSWAPDGRTLFGVPNAGGHVLAAALEVQKASVTPLWQALQTVQWPEVSPDGRWLAYGLGTNVRGRFDIYVRPLYSGAGPPEAVSFGGGRSPAWNPNGQELFFLSEPDPAGKRRMMAVEFTPGSPPRIGRPQTLFEFVNRDLSLGCIPVGCYAVARDGRGFYAVQTPAPPSQPMVTQINLIQNWFEELKAKVPIK